VGLRYYFCYCFLLLLLMIKEPCGVLLIRWQLAR